MTHNGPKSNQVDIPQVDIPQEERDELDKVLAELKDAYDRSTSSKAKKRALEGLRKLNGSDKN